MTYEKLVEKIKKAYAKAEATGIDGHKAIQLNVRGEGEGALYIEVSEGKFNVQPYEYYDNDAVVTISSKVLIDILEGDINPEDAFVEQKLHIIGDAYSANLILSLRKVNTAKKTYKKAVEETKKATKKAIEAAKPVAEKAVKETKKATKKAIEVATPVAEKAVEETKKAAKKAAESAKPAAKKAMDETKKSVKKAAATASKAIKAAAQSVKEDQEASKVEKAEDNLKKAAKKTDDKSEEK